MKFKDMTLKQKAEHIWEYYKLHIFAVVFAVFIICSLLYHFVIAPAPKVYSSIAIYGPRVSSEASDKLEAELDQKLIAPNVNETVSITNFFFTEGTSVHDPLQDSNMLDKFYTYLYSMQLDLFMGTEDDIKSCIEAGFLMPITDYLPEETINELNESGLIVYGISPDDKEEQPYGISLANSAIIKNTGLSEENTFFIGFLPPKERMENTKKTAMELIKK